MFSESNSLTALKTLSLRIRGYDEETEELSDDVIEATGKIASLTKVASNNFAGVSLWEDADQTKYRSLVDYLRDISNIINEVSASDKTKLLEGLFGKRGASVGSAILSNFSQVEKALKEMEDAAGSSDREMSIIQDSLEFRINRLKESWTGWLQTLAGRDAIGSAIDGLTGLTNVIQNLLGLFNQFPGGALPVTIGSFLGLQNTVKGRGAGKIFPVLMEQAACNAPFTGYRDFRRYGWGIYPAQNTRYCPNGRAA